MGFKEIKVQEEVSANLVPMIDIMFLLLLFFMLNADMSQRELEELTTPVANQAKEDKADDNSDRITCNLFHVGADIAPCALHSAGDICRDDAHWQIAVSGRRYRTTVEADLKNLEEQFKELADKKREKPGDRKSASDRHLLIRGDKYAPYGTVQRALERASAAGLYKVEVACQIEKSSLAQ